MYKIEEIGKGDDWLQFSRKCNDAPATCNCSFAFDESVRVF